jgi:membrane protein
MSGARYFFRVLFLSIKNFLGDSCFRHSATLSFYTLFSLAPMALISVQVASLFAAEVDFKRELVQQFTDLVGTQGAAGVEVLLDNLENEETTRFRIFIGALVLMFSATNIFIQTQEAFNQIFCVKSSGRGIIKKALDRLVSLGIILSLGLIMILSLVIDSAIVLLQNWLASSFPEMAVFFIAFIQYVVLALLGTAEIYALLHFLPDVHLPVRYKVRGCAVIALLLVCGKSAISGYISTNQLSELGGAAASVVVLMLWIYYSSAILFFGAETIRSMAAIDKIPLVPKRYAVKVKSVIVEEENQAKVEEEDAPAKAAEVLPAAAVNEDVVRAERGEEAPVPPESSAADPATPATMPSASVDPVVDEELVVHDESPESELVNARAAQN